MYQKELEIGLSTIQQAGKIALAGFSRLKESSITFKTAENGNKHHMSPVTQTDKDVEKFIIHELRKHFPLYGIFGEEFGSHTSDSAYRWIIDPIDGTREFIRGKKERGILLALQHHQDIVIGISYLPAYNELLRAAKGQGSRHGKQQLFVSEITTLQQSHICHERLKYLQRDGTYDAFLSLSGKVQNYTTRSLSQFHYLIKGNIDGAMGAEAYLYDYAPFICLVQEAGGQATQLNGDSLGGDYCSYLFSNGYLHSYFIDQFSHK